MKRTVTLDTFMDFSRFVGNIWDKCKYTTQENTVC